MPALTSGAVWAQKERATESSQTWQGALQRGCLSVSLNDKDKLYSHLKAVSAKQIGRSNLFPDAVAQGQISKDKAIEDRNAAIEAGDEEIWNLAEAEERYQPALRSPVIFENLTLPPVALDEKTLAFFTIHELLGFIRSPEWPEKVRLRLLGDDLLRCVNAALFSLEKRQLVNLHATYANANNRVPAGLWVKKENQASPKFLVADETGAKNEVFSPAGPAKGKGNRKSNKQKQGDNNDTEHGGPSVNDIVSTSNQKLALPKPFVTNPEYDYERLGLEIIFFEKTDQSNVRYIVPDFSQFDYFEDMPPPQPLPRLLNRQPHSLKTYNTDQIRLPHYENVNLKNTIDKLESEVLAIRAAQVEEETKPAPETSSGKSRGKEKEGKANALSTATSIEDVNSIMRSLNIPDVEDIGEDPVMKPAEVTINPPITPGGRKRLTSTANAGLSGLSTQTLERLSRSSVKAGDSSTLKQAVSIATASAERNVSGRSETKDASKSSLSLDPTLMNVSGSDSGSFNSVSSSLADEDDSLGENYIVSEDNACRLELTRQELYVSSLYAARETNHRHVEKTLEEKRHMHMTRHTSIAKEVLNQAKQNARVNLDATFKHLAKKKGIQNRRKTEPKCMSAKQPAYLVALKSAKQRSQTKGLDTKRPPSKQPPDGALSENEISAQQWEHYRILEEISEREATLKNDLEGGILERMPHRNFHPNYKPSGKKEAQNPNPSGRNRSQNKRIDNEGNDQSLRFKDYNLFLAINGKVNMFNQSEYKNNIISNSFCIDEDGKPSSQPSVGRIGFQSSEQLINYLISVRSAIRNNHFLDKWNTSVLARPLCNDTTYQTENIVYGTETRKKGDKEERCNKPVSSSLASTAPIPTNTLGMSKLTQNDNFRNKSDNNTGEEEGSASHMLQKSDRNGIHRTKHVNFSDEQGVRKSMDTNMSANGSDERGVCNGMNTNMSANAEDVDNELNGIETNSRASPVEPKSARGSSGSVRSLVDNLAQNEEKDAIREAEYRPSAARTVSEILEADLSCYGVACSCHECVGQAAYLNHLKPSDLPMTRDKGGPPVLGRLRRDYKFLKNATKLIDAENITIRRDSTGRLVLPERLPVLDAAQIGDALLEVMNEVMIRKEILSSSRGCTYTTITFTKRPSATSPRCGTKEYKSPFEQRSKEKFTDTS